MSRALHLLIAAATFALALPGAARAGQTVCVYDPGGKAGDYYRILEAWATEAAGWGASIELKAYTDEETATKDYEAGSCDGVVATGVRLQRFNRFPTTIEAVGALPSYDLLKSMINTLTVYESAAKGLKSGEHETVGFLPVGAVYLFVRDRSIDSVSDLAGKRIATLSYDQPSRTMVNKVGAIEVAADLGSMGPKFNNGDVDALYVSAPGYQPFELYRGLEGGGGILKSPLAQATLQILVRAGEFPDGFADASRKHLLGQFDSVVGIATRAEAAIPANLWVEITPATVAEWDEMFLAVRVDLRDNAGAYDKSMLSVMRKLRCGADGARAECAEQRE